MTNPYTPPELPADHRALTPRGFDIEGHADIRKRVSRPATALLVLASTHSVFPAIAIVSLIINSTQPTFSFQHLETLILVTIQFALLVGISIGAAKLGYLESYRFGRFAAICSCVPGISPFVFLGIPFGIWALRLLADPEVRSAFPGAPE